MSFSITANRAELDPSVDGEPMVSGRIEIGEYSENLAISLLIWSVDDYIRQWTEGLARLSRHSSSCLITSMRDLTKSDFVDWWVLYRVGDRVLFQNQIIIASSPLRDEFEKCPYTAIQPHITHNEQGQQISEWETPYCDIEAFLSGRYKPTSEPGEPTKAR